jgi:hypothetical protein
MSKTLAAISVLGLLLCGVFLGLARAIGGDQVFHDPRALEGVRPLIDMATRKEWRWAGGDTLAMDAPMTVHYRPQGRPNVSVTGPADAIEHVRFNAGRISADRGVPASARGKVEAVVSGIAIRKFVVNSSENLELGEIDQDALDIHINGNGRVRGNGKVRALSLVLSGSGQADLGALSVGDAKVSILGSGMATLSPHGRVQVFMAGSGRVALLTKPASVERQMVGSGTIIEGPDAAQPPIPPAPSAPMAMPAPIAVPMPMAVQRPVSVRSDGSIVSGDTVVVNGSQNIDLGHVDQPKLTVTLASSGEITGEGKVDELIVRALSSGRAHLGKLVARKVTVMLAGSADVTIAPTAEAQISILGSGNVRLMSRPPVISRNIVGSGRIIDGP